MAWDDTQRHLKTSPHAARRILVKPPRRGPFGPGVDGCFHSAGFHKWAEHVAKTDTGNKEIRVLLNSNLHMTKGKAAAQAIHAVLDAYGIPHGRVVVLNGTPNQIKTLPHVIYDAGLTEVAPGTLTAGAEILNDRGME